MTLISWPGDPASPKRSRASGFENTNGKGAYIPDRLGRVGQGTWLSPGDLRDPFGRLTDADAGVPLPGSDIPYELGLSLFGPVGASGENRPEDVAKVEALLGASGHLDLDATGGPTGYFGARTDRAVRDFQKDAGLTVDGRLNPGGETIRSLGQVTQGDAGRSSNELKQAIGETLLSFVPGVGEAMSAKDAYESGREALSAWKRGDWAGASKSGGLAALSALGAIPFAGTIARTGKGALKIGGPAWRALRKLFSEGKDFERFAKRYGERVPLGFAGREDVAKVVEGMQSKLGAAGFGDVTVAMRGSAATGKKFSKKTGMYDGPGFDMGRESDLDFALVSPKLFEALKKQGVSLKGNGTRTGVVDERVLKKLGLEGLLPNTFDGKMRDRSVVVFDSADSLRKRGPFMPLD